MKQASFEYSGTKGVVKVNFEREKAKLLVENLKNFVHFVKKSYHTNTYMSDSEKLFRLRNLVEEYKFQLLADEIERVNQFMWDEKVTAILVNRVRRGIESIVEYVENNKDGLFIFSARIHTLQSLCSSFSTI